MSQEQDIHPPSNCPENGFLTHHQIREKFLGFFEKRGHLRIHNSSLVPQNDPTLLVINSGMAPLKKFFTGEEAPPTARLTNIQKCVRTNDIVSVGNDRHLTFFEMMGNWSIGDYFKEDGLKLAWDLLVEEFKFDKSKLIVTVYGGDPSLPGVPPDEESFEIWRGIGLPSDRIFRLGADDNFWGPTSVTGPCGPCSEAFFDRGSGVGCGREDCGPHCGCGRYLEIWNTGVFMQYNKMEDGSFQELPFRSVDAGAGIERFAMVLQDVGSVYETDLLKPVYDSIVAANNLNVQDREVHRSLRIMSDHLKCAVFMMGDGIYPLNTGREYVVRRLLRRAASHSWLLGVSGLRTGETVDLVADNFGFYYPSLLSASKDTKLMVEREMGNFSKVLTQVDRELRKVIQRSGEEISGEDAFFLQDTLGLPFEILEMVAARDGLRVDGKGFAEQMEKQRMRSRASRSL